VAAPDGAQDRLVVEPQRDAGHREPGDLRGLVSAPARAGVGGPLRRARPPGPGRPGRGVAATPPALAGGSDGRRLRGQRRPVLRVRALSLSAGAVPAAVRRCRPGRHAAPVAHPGPPPPSRPGGRHHHRRGGRQHPDVVGRAHARDHRHQPGNRAARGRTPRRRRAAVRGGGGPATRLRARLQQPRRDAAGTGTDRRGHCRLPARPAPAGWLRRSALQPGQRPAGAEPRRRSGGAPAARRRSGASRLGGRAQ
jgi:hypothetical protein